MSATFIFHYYILFSLILSRVTVCDLSALLYEIVPVQELHVALLRTGPCTSVSEQLF